MAHALGRWRSFGLWPNTGLSALQSCERICHADQAYASQAQAPSTTGRNLGIAEAQHNSQQHAPNRLVQQTIRKSLAAETIAAELFAGQRAVLGRQRPDLAHMQEQETMHLQRLRQLVPKHRARPSLLAPLAAAAGFSLGAAAALVPTRWGSAITGAVQDSLTDHYNEQLRGLREAGVAGDHEEVRQELRSLRDEERAPHACVQVPDIMSLRDPGSLTPEQIAAAVIKWAVSSIVKAS